ncbi:hypothetical protein FOZ60_001322 [Perkinsus olseni]|uniref:Cyclin-dependent kinase 2 homolog n=2 Tax=Perkinsus olseni TaxID=32597 RepID=A0A7J6P0I2_PEROL|nr:hypothetical protein FOZ60_001322 [Perkinsus olseni]
MSLLDTRSSIHHHRQKQQQQFPMELMALVGEGIYGKVYKARWHRRSVDDGDDEDSMSGRICAVKTIKLRDESEGIPASVLREIGLLQALHHPNIVELRGFTVDLKASTIYLVFDFYQQDLARFIDLSTGGEGGLEDSLVKHISHGVLEGVAYLHSHKILHRDLKPHNILLNWDCSDIKIADFGLAREIGIPTGPLAVDVVTLWYRAPEALLGSTAYGEPLDVWSIGCIILEMLRGKAFVTGSSPEDQICKIFAILGAPDEATWPEADTLPLWRSHMRLVSRVVPLSDIVPEEASPAAVSLAGAMLKVCPSHRITCEEGLAAPYFQDHLQDLCSGSSSSSSCVDYPTLS